MGKQAYLIAGLAYGDEGKGSVVDFLVRQRQAGLVVRYNGGCQAGHNVVTVEGKHHTFSQFGAGTFMPGVRTHLSRHVLINPMSMMNEASHLCSLGVENVYDRLTVEGDALVVTPFQRAVNRILEAARGDNRHGSCGVGIGETRSDHLVYGDKVIFAKDLKNPTLLKDKLKFIQGISREKVSGLEMHHSTVWDVLAGTAAVDWCVREYAQWPGTVVEKDHLGVLMEQSPVTIFEGAQGVLLDEKYGEKDHNTWTDCTFGNADKLLAETQFDGEKKKIGVMRSYFTRHGAGTFKTEDRNIRFPDHNVWGEFQGEFRFGTIDIPALQFSLEVAGPVDELAVNHLDQWPEVRLGGFVRQLEWQLKTPVEILGFGNTAEGKIVRTKWEKTKP